MGQLDPNGTALLISDHGFVSGKNEVLPCRSMLERQHWNTTSTGCSRPKARSLPTMNWKGLNLLDVAPIVLAAHGLKAPKTMEGRVPVPFTGKQVQTLKSGDTRVNEETFSADEQLLQSLVDLGYLDENQLVSEEGRLQENRYYWREVCALKNVCPRHGR